MRKSLLSIVAVAAMVAPHLHAGPFGKERTDTLDNTTMSKVSKKKIVGLKTGWKRPWAHKETWVSDIAGFPTFHLKKKTVEQFPTQEDYDQYLKNVQALSEILPKTIYGIKAADESCLGMLVTPTVDGKWEAVKVFTSKHRMYEGLGAPDRVARKKGKVVQALMHEYALKDYAGWEYLTTKLDVEGHTRNMYYGNTGNGTRVSTDDVIVDGKVLTSMVPEGQETVTITAFQYAPNFQPAK